MLQGAGQGLGEPGGPGGGGGGGPGPRICSGGPGRVLKDWAVAQGTGQALAVGNRGVPQSSIWGFRGPGKAIEQGLATLGSVGL